MGKLIDADELLKAMDTWDKFGFEHTGCFVREPKDDFVTYVHYEDMLKSVNGMSTVEAIPKADYENRLKADVVAMLTELKTEIALMSDSFVEGRNVTITSWSGMQKRICELIQYKIDKLRGEEDETDKSNK